MPPLRLLLIVLLLLNLLALAAGMGWLGSSLPRGEPERLTNQVDPERIQLQVAVIGEEVPTPPPSRPPAREQREVQAPERTAPTAPQASADHGDQPTAAASETPDTEREAATGSEDPAPLREQLAQMEIVAPPRPEDEERLCIAFTNLNEQETSAVERMARNTGPLIATAAEITEPPDAWWVKIPPTGSRQAAEQRAAQLRALGINDLFIVRAEGPNQYAISLGIFRTEARARQHFSDLEARRVRGAEIAPRTPALYRIQISGPGSLIGALNIQLRQSFPDIVANECPQ